MATKYKLLLSALAVCLMLVLTASGTNTSATTSREGAATDTSLVKKYSINTRVLQWRHYFAVVQTKSLESKQNREFYHTAVLKQFIDSGIPKDRAEIYAEIPDVESLWRPSAVSPKGALGMWQIMPSTALRYRFNPSDMHDPVKATRCAGKYLAFLDSLYHGDAAAVLFSYNGGENGVTKQAKTYQTNNFWLIDFASRETYDYAPKVLGAWLYNNQHN